MIDAARPRLFAGLDVSTQSCKLVVIDLATDSVVHIDRVVYDDDLPHYGTKDGVIADAPTGVSESDPRMWIEAVETVLERLGESDVDVRAIAAIAVSGQQHGLVALAADGSLARARSKLWNDFSTSEECELLTEAVGGVDAMIAEVGNSQRTGYTAGKIFHMARHEPEAFAATATFLIVKDYVNWYLTGGVVASEPGDTSGTALWNPATGAWSSKVVEAIDPGLNAKLPPVGSSDRPIGTIGASLAERFGFSPYCLVAPGSGDNMCAAVGTGNVAPGTITISLGTSGTAATVLDEPFVDPKGEIASYRDATGRYLPLLCVSNLANGYNELLRLHRLSHGAFDGLVDETPPGNQGRVLIPWYEGERTPDVPHAAPTYFGFDLESLALGPLGRAVVEGHVLNLHAGFEGMPIDLTEVDDLRLTGGLAQSRAWRQTLADVFDARVVPVEGEGAALGAAITAAWVWYADAAERGTEGDTRSSDGTDAGTSDGPGVQIGDFVDRFVRVADAEACSPRSEHAQTYADLRALYRALSNRVRGLPGADPFELRRRLV